MLNQSIDSKQLEQLIFKEPILFVEFWASWCAPCKEFSKIYTKVAQEVPQIPFATFNIEDDPETAEQFEIRSIPYLLIFKEGIIVYAEAGSIPESTLKELVVQAQDIDVSEIKKRLREED